MMNIRDDYCKNDHDNTDAAVAALAESRHALGGKEDDGEPEDHF